MMTGLTVQVYAVYLRQESASPSCIPLTKLQSYRDKFKYSEVTIDDTVIHQVDLNYYSPNIICYLVVRLFRWMT